MHKDKQYLEDKINQGYTPKQISKELRVSYKLVEIYLRQYGISFVPTKN